MNGLRLALALLASALLAGAAAAAPKRLLLVGQGPDGHPPATHEYVAGLKVLEKCLKGVPGVEIMSLRADEPWQDGPELLARADGVVLYLAEGAKWMQRDPKRQAALKRVLDDGGGLVVLHWAMGTRDAGPIDGCLALLGGCHGGPDRKYAVLETQVKVAEHPVTTGIKDFRVKDEFYYRLKFARAEGAVRPLLRADIDGAPEVVAWAFTRPEGGRAFGFSGLHFHDNWRLPEYRRLAAQGALWSLGLPIPRDGLAVEVDEAGLKLK
jgi:hypothetical protein